MVQRVGKWFGRYIGDIISLIIVFLLVAMLLFVAWKGFSWELDENNGAPNVYGSQNSWIAENPPVVVVMNDNKVMCSYVIPDIDYRGEQDQINKFDCEGKEGLFYGSGKQD